MNRCSRFMRIGMILLLFVASPAIAHHSFSAEYNITATLTLKGEIVDVEWSNPHVFLRLAVRDKSDSIQLWHVEGGAISAVKENGWTLAMLQQLVQSHDPVVVSGYRGRKSSPPMNEAWGKTIELADGRTLPFN
ncbi:MAG TPA: DUF6152 family protein [Terriglobia bacterium]|nr:DUF6152 family protein [Terriglobia bacterium]